MFRRLLFPHRLRSDLGPRLGARTAGAALGLFVAAFCAAPRSATAAPAIAGDLVVWGEVTLTWDGPQRSEADNATFTDHRLDVTFTQGSRTIVVPGYFAADGQAAETGADSGNKWRAHFRPPTAGTWNYAATFRTGTNVAAFGGGTVQPLAGANGSLLIAPAPPSPPGLDLRTHGRLVWDGTRYPRFLGSGESFLKRGSDSPENFLAYTEFDGTYDNGGNPNWLEDHVAGNGLHRYDPHIPDWRPGDPTWRGGLGKGIIGAVNYMAQAGINSMYMLTCNRDGDGDDVWPWRSHTTTLQYDCSKLDQWKIVFDHMERRGVMLHLVLTESENYWAAWFSDLVWRIYVRELAARFGHHLAVVWNIGEENGWNADTAVAKAQQLYDALPYKGPGEEPLIVIHNGWGTELTRFEPLYGRAPYTGISLQLANWKGNGANKAGERTRRFVEGSAAAGRPWFVMVDEIGNGIRPDGEANNSQVEARKEVLWPNLLSGGAGVEWYFGWAGYNGATGAIGGGERYADLGAEDLRSRAAMWAVTRHATEFFRTHRIPFRSMSNQDTLTSQTDDTVLALRGHTYVVYRPNGGTAALDLSGQSGTYRVRWFDPRNGGPPLSGTTTTVTGGGAATSLGQPPTAPAGSDWTILVTRARERQLIYTDQLHDGWADWSWAARDFNHTGTVAVGTRSIAVTPGGWQALYLRRSDTPLTGLQALQLRLHGGAAGGQTLRVAAVRGNNATGSFVDLPPLPANRWIVVTVPLHALNAPAVIDGFWVQNRTANALPTFYADEIVLLGDYDAWAEERFPTPGLADPFADPDGDGVVNALEWALGTEPNDAHSVARPAVAIVPGPGGASYPAIEYSQPLDRVALPLGPELSFDLVTWHADAEQFAIVSDEVDHAGGWRHLVVRSAHAVETQPRQFLRLRLAPGATAAGPSSFATVFPATSSTPHIVAGDEPTPPPPPPPPDVDPALYPPHAVIPVHGITIPGLPPVTGRIHVDQFGYRPEMAKVAVISDPQVGYNAHESYTPGDPLQVRRRSDGAVVFSGSPTLWNGGAIHADSGDRGWWFDFSALTTPGEYYVYDPSRDRRSPLFRIAANPWSAVLRAALRTYYYQRLAVPLTTPYAEAPWTDGPGFPQDAQARLVTAKNNPATARDLAGGWMDAGDSNKYPTFLAEVIHPLLHAWRAHPSVFGDDLGIPESGNGLPDLLDEVKFELDWLLKMQDSDGGVFIKMGNVDYNSAWPISTDTRPRYYGPKCSASTLWTAGVFAHAARVYRQIPAWQSYAQTLEQRALQAWFWYTSNPRSYNCDTGEIKSGSANRDAAAHDRMEAIAAIHLWILTGDDAFHPTILQRVPQTRQMAEGWWSPYELGAAEALLDYAAHPAANTTLRDQIRQKLRSSSTNNSWAPPPSSDLYRAWMNSGAYHWGSCMPRAAFGIGALLAAELPGTSAAERTRLRQRAADMLHSFHGVNPQGIVYLSNMGSLGAESSVRRIWHDRFPHHSPLAANPPPGYVVGGPNQNYLSGGPSGQAQFDWIRTQPRGKAFADFNLPWPGNSWEITEPAIYYQALYIRLLAALAAP